MLPLPCYMIQREAGGGRGEGGGGQAVGTCVIMPDQILRLRSWGVLPAQPPIQDPKYIATRRAIQTATATLSPGSNASCSDVIAVQLPHWSLSCLQQTAES